MAVPIMDRLQKYSDDYQKVLDGTIKYDDKGERILNKKEDAK